MCSLYFLHGEMKNMHINLPIGDHKLFTYSSHLHLYYLDGTTQHFLYEMYLDDDALESIATYLMPERRKNIWMGLDLNPSHLSSLHFKQRLYPLKAWQLWWRPSRHG